MRALIRTSSFFTSWIGELLRRPLLIVGLVIGPFLILIAFGQGVDYSGIKPDVIVVSGEATEDQPLRPLPAEISEYVNVVEETTDLNAAIQKLRDGEVDGVAVIPPDPAGTIEEGERIPVQIFTSDIDPVSIQFTEAYLRDQVADLNQQALAEAITEAQSAIGDLDGYVAEAKEFIELARSADQDVAEIQQNIDEVQALLGPLQQTSDAVVSASLGVSFILPGVSVPREEIRRFDNQVDDLVASVDSIDQRLDTANVDGGLPSEQELNDLEAQLDEISGLARELSTIPADVLAAPFVLELENVSPFDPTFTGYFSPAVLVLLLQHLGISLAALSMTRIRLLGVVDLLRVAPIRAFEILNGNYMSYVTVMALVALGGLATMWYVIDIPMYGSYLELAAIIGLLALTTLGIGFLVAMLTTSEQNAAQVAMLVLLSAVFFSGLVVSLDRLAWPFKAVSFALPSTYAIRSTQDVMLRGVLRHPEDLIALAGAAIVLYLATYLLLRRELRPKS